MTKTIIGLTGHKGAGKDTAGGLLTERHGFLRVAFADQIRTALYTVNPLLEDGSRVQDAVDDIGWDRAKAEIPEVRSLLQRLGADAIREMDPDFWLRIGMGLAEKSDDPVVITDVRFPNEVAAIEALGGTVCRVVHRCAFGCHSDAAQHISEIALEGYDFPVIDNTMIHDDMWSLIYVMDRVALHARGERTPERCAMCSSVRSHGLIHYDFGGARSNLPCAVGHLEGAFNFVTQEHFMADAASPFRTSGVAAAH